MAGGNFGIGIGSFLEGLAKGYQTVREADMDEARLELLRRTADLAEKKEAREADFDNRRMKVYEAADIRAADNKGNPRPRTV